MKLLLPATLAACVVLAACSPQYRNGAVRPTLPETLAGAHADPNAKPKAAAEPDAQAGAKTEAATPDDPYL
jgi:hypothetical protein